MKILVVGCPRSGTTMTMQFFQYHPSVRTMFMEKFVLIRQPFNQFIKKYPYLKTDTWGEKITYVKPIIGRSGLTPVDYCEKWNKLFGNEARIIQIVRHPNDMWNSLLRLRKKQGRAKNIPKQVDRYIDSIIKYTSAIDSYPNCLTIKYEDVIDDSKTMTKKLYDFCWLPKGYYHKKKMRKNRIFAYKKDGILIKRDFSKVIEELNKIEGIKY